MAAAKLYGGIDLGGTQIKAGIVDDRGRKVLAIEPIATEAARGPEVGLDNLARAGKRNRTGKSVPELGA